MDFSPPSSKDLPGKKKTNSPISGPRETWKVCNFTVSSTKEWQFVSIYGAMGHRGR